MIAIRRSFAGLGVVIAACALAACAAPGPAHTVRSGVPEGVDIDPTSAAPVAAWLERGETFAIVTMGSSSCPPVATGLGTEGADRVAVTFGPSPNGVCTADMGPTTHEFALPDGVTSAPVTIAIAFEDWPETYAITLD